MRPLTPILICITALALLGGCGGGDDEASGDASSDEVSITKVSFVRQANEVCIASAKKVAADLESLLAQSTKPQANQKSPELAVVSDVLIPNIEAEVRKINSLGIPDGDDGEVGAIMIGYDEMLNYFESNPEKFGEDPDPYRHVEKSADAYGLVDCPMG